jgi:flagellar protein FliS
MTSSGHHAYQVSAIETASPEQLTLLCYDGALKFMRRAQRACEEGDIARLGEASGRAQAIVNELNVTLNMEAGGEIATNLRQIYLFVNRHLMQSTVKHDASGIVSCVNLIQGLRESWAEAMGLSKPDTGDGDAPYAAAA